MLAAVRMRPCFTTLGKHSPIVPLVAGRRAMSCAIAGIIASGFALFGLAVKYLPIFPGEEPLPELQPSKAAVAGNVVGEAVPENAGD